MSLKHSLHFFWKNKTIRSALELKKSLLRKTKLFSQKYLAAALQIQLIPAIGYLISFFVGIAYMFLSDYSKNSSVLTSQTFQSKTAQSLGQNSVGTSGQNLQPQNFYVQSVDGPIENLYPTLIGFCLSFICFLFSFYFSRKIVKKDSEKGDLSGHTSSPHDSNNSNKHTSQPQNEYVDQHGNEFENKSGNRNESKENHQENHQNDFESISNSHDSHINTNFKPNLNAILKPNFKPIKVNLNKAAWVVFFAWAIAILISSVVYLIAGFPSGGKPSFVTWSIPPEIYQEIYQSWPRRLVAINQQNPINGLSLSRSIDLFIQNFELFTSFRPTINFSLSVFWNSFSDSVFESVSGFTTTGSSILPNIEIFPKSVLFWRSFGQWLGGMGMAYMAATFIKKFLVSRNEIINSEVESPTILEYETELEARKSGMKFFLAYFSMTMICVGLLLVSSLLFRNQSIGFAGSLFEALIHGMGAVASGGFSNYNSSVGNGHRYNVDGTFAVAGLQNHISEWIMAVFMLFSGINFGIWYIVLFNRKQVSRVWRNRELWVYLAIVLFLTTGIWAGMIDNQEFLGANPQYQNPINSLRYAFFNVSTIISTAGYSNTDFTRWPSICLGLLFACFLLGGCVGSTSGGLKISRFVIMYRFAEMEIKNIIFGNHRFSFVEDDIKYNYKKASIVILNIAIYFILFLVGGVLIMATSPVVKFVDGSIDQVDFVSAMTASLSTLGGIGPAASVGVVDAGPNGNYGAYSSSAKWIMSFLMYFGRVGVISIFMMFMTKKGESEVEESLPESKLV